MKWDSGRNRETERFKKGIGKAIGIKNRDCYRYRYDIVITIRKMKWDRD